MKSFLYFLYYLKELDFKKYRKFLNYVSKQEGLSKWKLIFENVYDSIKYKVSILEYFQFHFYKSNAEEKNTYAGTGYMYEYQLAMNPREERTVLHDKRVFLHHFTPFIKHKYATLEQLILKPESFNGLIEKNPKRLILKSHDGQCGKGIMVIPANGLTVSELIKQLQDSGNDIAEEYIEQHDDLMNLSPSGLNTIRIFTQLKPDRDVDIIGCRIRISVNSIVDNLAAGNIAAPVDEYTGIVTGPGHFSDITKSAVTTHPITGVNVVGFKVPFWEETINMVRNAAAMIPGCKSVGWDIAITNAGPELIEGNHDWCKLVWQLPVQQGLKPVLEQYKTNLN